MNKIISKLLLTGEKFNTNRIQKSEVIGLNYIFMTISLPKKLNKMDTVIEILTAK